MEKQRASKNRLPLVSSLRDLIPNPKSEKIRRPPNAFMLFAKDHRRIIANQNPDMSNKAVSTMLGKIWKSSSEGVKSKYYKRAGMVGELHKKLYPNYVYSPREARMQKMSKKKKKDEASCCNSVAQNEDLAATMTIAKEGATSNAAEEWMTAANQDPDADHEYVPNNPEYFDRPSSEINSEEEDQEELDQQQPGSGYSAEGSQYPSESGGVPMKIDGEWVHPDKNRKWQMPPGICRCCNRNKSGSKARCTSPHEGPERERMSPYFSEPFPCSYATPSSLCNPPGHFTRPMSPYYCNPQPCTSPVPRSYGPPFPPYWNPPRINSTYYPGRERFYEDVKPFPYSTPYHIPDYFGHPFGRFDRPQLNRNLNYTFQPHFNDRLDFYGRAQNEFASRNSESYHSFGRCGEKRKNAEEENSRAEDEMDHQSDQIVRSGLENDDEKTTNHPARSPGTATEEAVNIPKPGTVSEIGMHSRGYQNQCIWNINSPREKMAEMFSNEFVSTRHHRPDFVGGSGTENEADFIVSNNLKAKEQKLASSFAASESNLNQINSEDNSYVGPFSPKWTKGPSFPMYESPRVQTWNSTAVKPHMPMDVLEQHRCTSKLDERPFPCSAENNLTDAYGPKLSLDTKKTPANFDRAVQNENCSENIAEHRSADMHVGCNEAEIQMAKKFYSADSRNILMQRINEDISVDKSPPQFSVPFVKREENCTIPFPMNAKRNCDSVSAKTNTGNEDNNDIDPVGDDDASYSASNQCVNSNRFVKISNNRPNFWGDVVARAEEVGIKRKPKYDFSIGGSPSNIRPMLAQEKIPGFPTFSKNPCINSQVSNQETADCSRPPILQPVIKLENNYSPHHQN